MRILPTLLIALLLTTAGGPRDTRGADVAPDQLESASRQLGDPDASVRERAAATLRAAGPAAEAPLRAVADAGDPEAARRARALLRELKQPEPEEPALADPPELTAYRNADADAKNQRIVQLAGGGAAQAGVLARLWAEEQDDELRAAMFRAMLISPPVYASALVAHGNEAAAERLLEASLAQGNTDAAASYAALAMLRGNLNDVIARWSRRQPGEDVTDGVIATVLTRLHRAAGDLPNAVAAARRSGDAALLEETLVAAGDWAALAEELERRPAQQLPGAADRPKRLGKLAAAYHLAGNAKAFDDVLARMRKIARPDTLDDIAHVLLTAGRCEDGLAVLGESSDSLNRLKMLASQERWDDAWQLLASQDAARDERALRLRAAAAEMLYVLGEDKQAADLLARVAEENRAAPLAAIEAALGTAYRRIGERDRAWDHFRTAVRAEAKPGQDPSQAARVTWAAFFVDDDADGDPDLSGSALWEILAERYPAESVDQRFDRARAVVDDTASADDLKALLGDAPGGAAFPAVGEINRRLRRNPSRRFRTYESNLITLVGERGRRRAGGAEAAEALLAAAAEIAPAPEHAAALHQRLGDWAADRNDWPKAAAAYARAWNADRGRPAPLYLRGWALAQAGWHARAAERMNLAHELPLADAWRRYEAVRALHDRRLYEPAAREVDTILRTSRQDQYAAHIAMQLSADDAARRGDLPAAIAARERMLFNLMGVFDLTEPAGYLRVPYTLHRDRAKALLVKRDVDGAAREIVACQAVLPGDVLLAIDVVPELERLGDRARADAIYADAMRVQERVIAKYPGAANHRNDIAWLAVNCGRDLDKALAHATRAVELRPKNAAYVDTLAEVQFRRGDIDEAIKTMRRCVELEPRQGRHKEQIERFEAKRRGEDRPLPPT